MDTIQTLLHMLGLIKRLVLFNTFTYFFKF